MVDKNIEFMILICSMMVNGKHIMKGYVKKTPAEKRQQIVEITEKLDKELHEFIHLEVRKDDKKAVGLYKKFGFEEINVRKDYYGKNKDASCMVKGLVGCRRGRCRGRSFRGGRGARRTPRIRGWALCPP